MKQKTFWLIYLKGRQKLRGGALPAGPLLPRVPRSRTLLKGICMCGVKNVLAVMLGLCALANGLELALLIGQHL